MMVDMKRIPALLLSPIVLAAAAACVRPPQESAEELCRKASDLEYELRTDKEADYTTVAGLYRQAAELGYAPAQLAFARCRYTGRGVEKDMAKGRNGASGQRRRMPVCGARKAGHPCTWRPVQGMPWSASSCWSAARMPMPRVSTAGLPCTALRRMATRQPASCSSSMEPSDGPISVTSPQTESALSPPRSCAAGHRSAHHARGQRLQANRRSIQCRPPGAMTQEVHVTERAGGLFQDGAGKAKCLRAHSRPEWLLR